jgi:hypothetical protein
MTMTTSAARNSAPSRWSMTGDALKALRTEAERLAVDVDRRGGYVTAQMTGEPSARALFPNIDGQRQLRQFNAVHGAVALARVETDERLAVIGRLVTLEGPDGARTNHALVIPGAGSPANGRVSADSPLGRAIFGRRAGDEVRVDAPGGTWTASVVSVE